MKTSKDAARRFALMKQSFRSSQAFVTKKHILSVLERLGCVQIDTINVVERSHYLVFWSRFSNYRKELLSELLYPDRKVFEYWAHAASLIPTKYYRYFTPAMRKRKEKLRGKAKRWLKGKADLVDTVLDEIKRKGPLCSKDFERDRGNRNRKTAGWWNWKPAKIALELLYDAGVLMVSRREKFQKYYDLTENVLPSNIDASEPTEVERQRFFVEKTLDAWGFAELKDFSQYFYKWSTKTDVGVRTVSALMKDLQKQDLITTTHVEGIDGPYFMLVKDLSSIAKVASNKEGMDRVSFISPFDNLTWSKPRTKKLFEFHPALETYVPKQNRKFGYYALNILYRSQIVGRIDPKMHRDKAVLEIRALELKDCFKPDEDFKQKLASALDDFAKFNNAETTKVREGIASHILPKR